MGACMLVRRAAIDEVGPPDADFFLFSEEVDWCYRFAPGGLEDALHPGGAVRPRRRRLARRRALSRERPRASALLPQASRPEEAEQVRSLLRASLVLRGSSSAGSRGDVPRRRPLARDGRRPLAARAMSSVFLLVRLAARDGTRARAGGDRGPRGRACGARRRRSPGGSAIVFGAMGVVVRSSMPRSTLALVLLARRRGRRGAVRVPPAGRAAASRGAARSGSPGSILGLLLWHVAGEIGGDGLFHLARARKLLELGDLSLVVGERVRRRRAPPGYAFPLWHGFLALVAKVALHRPGRGRAPRADRARPARRARRLRGRLRRVPARDARRCLGGAAVAIAAMAPGHGGAYTALALPATAARQLLVPAALALALAAMRRPSPGLLASAGVASLVLAVVHPTYAIFLWIPFGGFLPSAGRGAGAASASGALALAALVVPGRRCFSSGSCR